MAPGGQGALVDVCDSKAHPQRPARNRPGQVAPWAGLRPGRAAARGQLGTGGLKVLGLGPPQRPPRRKGKLRPSERRAQRRATQHVRSVRCARVGEGGGTGS